MPPSQPGIPVISTGVPFWSLNIPTAVSSCGTNPLNHAERKLSEVPVFPADGRPRLSPAYSPDPSCVTAWRASMRSLVCAASKTRCGAGSASKPMSLDSTVELIDLMR